MAAEAWRSYPLERPPVRLAGVPHRFGIGVLLILVTFFSVLFAVLASLGVPPGVFAVVGVLFVGVAAGQSLLFGGKSPRAASIFVGMVLFPLEMLATEIYLDTIGNGGWSNPVQFDLSCTVTSGGLLGYSAGGVMAAIFLAMNRWSSRRRKAVAPVELRPFAGSDIDALLDWVHDPALRRRWARSIFREPPERGQIRHHLERAARGEPESLAFIAVCPATGQAVGYVELRDIDLQRQSATVDRALIAPNEPARDKLSVGLLQAILDLAFGQMRLQRVETIVPADDEEPRGCYEAMGFATERVLRDAFRRENVFQDERIMTRFQHEWLSDAQTWYGRPPEAGTDQQPVEEGCHCRLVQ